MQIVFGRIWGNRKNLNWTVSFEVVFSCYCISEVRSEFRSFSFFNKGYEISPIGIVEWLTPYMLPETMITEGFKFKIIGTLSK